jgi:hypothetical protein
LFREIQDFNALDLFRGNAERLRSLGLGGTKSGEGKREKSRSKSVLHEETLPQLS